MSCAQEETIANFEKNITSSTKKNADKLLRTKNCMKTNNVINLFIFRGNFMENYMKH